MTTPAGRGGNGVMAASGVAELGAEALAARTSYGEGALVARDQVVRIYTGDGIEVQALQGRGWPEPGQPVTLRWM